MASLIKVLICIQARSTSTRLPNKCIERIGSKRLLDHVIDACTKSAAYSNRLHARGSYSVDTALLIPYGDPIEHAFAGQMKMVQGPELDVLERFRLAKELYRPDFICRITGDCPLIPSYIITKHITLATACEYDYISNVHEDCRLSLDGIDCEVMSVRMLDWLVQNAASESEKEHVTILARKNPPNWANIAFTANFFDASQIKLSVDTKEDLENVRIEYEKVASKVRKAEKIYGRHRIHRF